MPAMPSSPQRYAFARARADVQWPPAPPPGEYSSRTVPHERPETYGPQRRHPEASSTIARTRSRSRSTSPSGTPSLRPLPIGDSTCFMTPPQHYHPRAANGDEACFAGAMSALTRSPAWQALLAHQAQLATTTMRALFAADPGRFARMSREACGLFVDWSKHRATDETWRLLLALAQDADVAGWRDRMFSGARINVTEDRAVLH